MEKGANNRQKAEWFSELVGFYGRSGKLAEEEELEHLSRPQPSDIFINERNSSLT
jgi:hypothetical protein